MGERMSFGSNRMKATIIALIVFTIIMIGLAHFMRSNTDSRRFLQTRAELNLYERAVVHYAMMNGEIPDDIADLDVGARRNTPYDRYNPNSRPGDRQPYGYIPYEDGSWVLYSWGPDGEDDEGEIVYDEERFGKSGPGDIVRSGTMEPDE